jgi:hypothetical protein
MVIINDEALSSLRGGTGANAATGDPDKQEVYA